MINITLIVFLIVASYQDIRRRKVSNRFTLILLLAACIFYLANNFTVISSLIILAIYLVLNMMVYKKMLGGADVKVFLILLLIFGAKAFFVNFVVTHYLAGFYRLFRNNNPSIAFMPLILIAFLITNYGGLL